MVTVCGPTDTSDAYTALWNTTDVPCRNVTNVPISCGVLIAFISSVNNLM